MLCDNPRVCVIFFILLPSPLVTLEAEQINFQGKHGCNLSNNRKIKVGKYKILHFLRGCNFKKNPGAHTILPFPSKIAEEMPGICEARIEKNNVLVLSAGTLSGRLRKSKAKSSMCPVAVKQGHWLV